MKLETRNYMENYTKTLADFAEKLQYEDLPQPVVEKTKMFIADYYAACFAGYRVNRQFNKVTMDLIREEGGEPQASVLLEEKKYPVGNAAFMNAAYAHGADMDDGNRKSAGHIGTHVISAVFALSEKRAAAWNGVIAAINVGYEFFNRIAGAAQPGLYNKGFHSTGVAGAMACGAACAKLIGLGADGIYNAVSLAAIQSSGLIIIDESGQGCKPINPANAARTGVLSALMAEKGLVSSRNPLESKKGWFQAFADVIDEKTLLDGLGKEFTICESYLKLYPTCRHTHSCIDAALGIRRQIFDKGYSRFVDIERINVFIYPSAIKSAGSIRRPKTSDEAKFSIHYATALAFCRGGFGLEDLLPEDTDEQVDYLIERIALIADSSMENREKGIRGARVRVAMRDGTVFEEAVPIPKGEGNGSLTWMDLQKKMMDCSRNMIVEDMARLFVENCKNINANDKFVSIWSLIKRKE